MARDTCEGTLLGRTRFFGRGPELEFLRRALLQHPGMVTLLGPPGAGKTRLAVRLLQEAKQIGLWVKSGLRLNELEGIALEARGLLLFDDLEENVAEVARLVQNIASRAPGCSFLLVGRARLSLPSEQVLEVGGLDEEAAQALFIDRARALDHRFSPEPDAPALRVIIRRLNAMPLALELAALHTQVMTLEQIALALDRRFELLVAPESGSPSLYDGLQRAWKALPASARKTLSKIAVFGGPFRLEDAADLLGLELSQTHRSIKPLLDAGLLSTEGASAGTLVLYETIREFALEKLSAKQSAGLFTRHAERFATLGERWAMALHESDPTEAVIALDQYQSELFVALSRAKAPRTKVQVALALDALLLSLGLVRVHNHVLRQGARAAKETGDPRLSALMLAAQCRATMLRGGFGEAIKLAKRATRFAEKEGDATLLILVQCTESSVLREAGQPKVALAIAEQTLALAERCAEPALKLRPLFNRASALADLDLVASARYDFCDVIALAKSHRAKRVQALALANWAILDERTGPMDVALERLRAALDIFETIGERYITAKCSAILSGWLSRAGLLIEAETHLAKARALAERIDDQEATLFANLAKAQLFELRGHGQRARYEVELALHTAQRMSAAMATRDANEALQTFLSQRLIVARSGDWFDLMRQGEVRLSRRPALRRILGALVAHRVTRPGAPLLAGELVEIGWPGERMSTRSGAERVYTAIRTLRQLGLQNVLVRREGGYALDPAIAVERV